MKKYTRFSRLFSVFLGIIISVEVFSLLDSYEKKEKYVSVVSKVMPAVVEIQVIGTVVSHVAFETDDGIIDMTEEHQEHILGSGVYINKNGYILTVAHLFNHFKKIQTVSVVSPEGDIVSGKIKNVSKSIDLALIKTDFYRVTPYVKVASPKSLRVGQEVVAIGSPAGLSFSVSNGIISALYRDFEFAYNVTQSNTAINPGNSGGPLFNLDGELVGVNSFFIYGNRSFPVFTGLGFSVQSGQCIEFLAKNAKKFKDMKREHFWTKLLDKVGYHTYNY